MSSSWGKTDFLSGEKNLRAQRAECERSELLLVINQPKWRYISIIFIPCTLLPHMFLFYFSPSNTLSFGFGMFVVDFGIVGSWTKVIVAKMHCSIEASNPLSVRAKRDLCSLNKSRMMRIILQFVVKFLVHYLTISCQLRDQEAVWNDRNASYYQRWYGIGCSYSFASNVVVPHLIILSFASNVIVPIVFIITEPIFVTAQPDFHKPYSRYYVITSGKALRTPIRLFVSGVLLFLPSILQICVHGIAATALPSNAGDNTVVYALSLPLATVDPFATWLMSLTRVNIKEYLSLCPSKSICFD